MNHIREELAAVLREIHLAENSHYRQDADALLASPVVRNIQESAWLKGYAAGREPQGEPSDAQVRAAWDFLGSNATVHLDFEDLRAALRAAGGVR